MGVTSQTWAQGKHLPFRKKNCSIRNGMLRHGQLLPLHHGTIKIEQKFRLELGRWVLWELLCIS